MCWSRGVGACSGKVIPYDVFVLQHGQVPNCLFIDLSLWRLPSGDPSLSHKIAACISWRVSCSFALSVASPAVSLVFILRADVGVLDLCWKSVVVVDCKTHPSPSVLAYKCHPPSGEWKVGE